MIPEIVYPVKELKLPISDQTIKFRPMLVKEEKLLLMAKAGDDRSEILKSVTQITQRCVVHPEKFDIQNLSIADLEFLFIQIRGSSIGEVIELQYNMEGEKAVPIKINISEIIVNQDDVISDTIATPSGKIKLRFPTARIYGIPEIINAKTESEIFDVICSDALVSFTDTSGKLTEFKDIPVKDTIKFIDSLNLEAYNKIQEFVANAPYVYCKHTYMNPVTKEEDSLEMKTLDDFFQF